MQLPSTEPWAVVLWAFLIFACWCVRAWFHDRKDQRHVQLVRDLAEHGGVGPVDPNRAVESITRGPTLLDSVPRRHHGYRGPGPVSEFGHLRAVEGPPVDGGG